jgi:ComF family protein
MNLVDRFCKQLNYGLFPPLCRLCGNPGMPELDLCALCFQALPSPPPVLTRDTGLVLAGFEYRDSVALLIRHFKFHAQLDAGRLLARLSESAFAASQPLALVPIPLHTRRLRQRGFNQALELARYWGRCRGLPVLSGALRRVHETTAQSTLAVGDRVRNMHGAFHAGVGLPAHVALIDDVFTTGATCHAACTALHAAGVQRVDVWCLARVL